MSPIDYGLTKPAYSVNEMLDLLPFGRSRLYEMISDGTIKTVKVGKKRIGTAPDIAAFLNRVREASDAPAAA